jgi:dihydrofolate reductase
MRKIILFMHMSLDGFVAGPNNELDWTTRNDDEVGKYLISDLLTTVDTTLLGRELYKGFESYWPAAAANPETPKELAEFARWVDNSPKIVFSSTLKKAEWKNSRIINGDITKEVAKLKQEPGKDIVVFGGARMSSTLASHDLIDEYRLKLEPVIIGKGKPLFKDIKEKIKLKLVKSKIFNSGVAGLYYQPDRS